MRFAQLSITRNKPCTFFVWSGPPSRDFADQVQAEPQSQCSTPCPDNEVTQCSDARVLLAHACWCQPEARAGILPNRNHIHF